MSDIPVAKLYLVIEAPRDASALERVKTIVSSVRPACVLIAPADRAPLDATVVKTLVEHGQACGIAVLVADDAGLARTVKADGVHLSWTADLLAHYETARDILGAHAIVGVDAGSSRHDAMSVAEAGADYVAFSPLTDGEGGVDVEGQLEMVGWWAEIFEVPVVALGVETGEQAECLKGAGTDFLAVRLPAGMAADDAAAFLRTVTGAPGRAVNAN